MTPHLRSLATHKLMRFISMHLAVLDEVAQHQGRASTPPRLAVPRTRSDPDQHALHPMHTCISLHNAAAEILEHEKPKPDNRHCSKSTPG